MLRVCKFVCACFETFEGLAKEDSFPGKVFQYRPVVRLAHGE